MLPFVELRIPFLAAEALVVLGYGLELRSAVWTRPSGRSRTFGSRFHE